MKHLFKKLFVAILGAMSLSACASLLPSMPNFNSSQNYGNTSNVKNSSSNNDVYDGPYTLSFFGTDFRAEVGKTFKVSLLVYNNNRQGVGVTKIEVDYKGLNVSDAKVASTNNNISFTINEPCTDAEVGVTAYVKGGQYEVAASFYVSAFARAKIVLSDPNSSIIKKNQWHRTVIEVLNVLTNERLDIHNYDCEFYASAGDVSYGNCVFRNYTDNVFEAYIRPYDGMSVRMSARVYDHFFDDFYETDVLFTIAGTSSVNTSVGWGSNPVVGHETDFNISLYGEMWSDRPKIQDVYLYSEETSIIANASLENVNTTETVHMRIIPLREGYTDLVFKIVAADGNIYYECVGFNVFAENAFRVEGQFSDPFYQDWRIQRGVEYTFTLRGYSYLNGELVQLSKIDVSETTTRYRFTSGITISSVSCEGTEAKIKFTISSSYRDTVVEFTGNITSTSGYQCYFGFGYEVASA